jgi:hypothetical protein
VDGVDGLVGGYFLLAVRLLSLLIGLQIRLQVQ